MALIADMFAIPVKSNLVRLLPYALRSRYQGTPPTKSKQAGKGLDIAVAASWLELGRNRENLTKRHHNRLVLDLHPSVISLYYVRTSITFDTLCALQEPVYD